MKRIALLSCFVMFYSTVAGAAQQAPPARKPLEARPLEQIETSIIRYQKATPRIFDTLESMKKAKASYIQELTVPPENAGRYRTNAARRQMVGVYLFDMSYASVFDKKKQVAASVEALQLLLKATGVNDRKLHQQYQRIVDEYGAATMKHLVINYEKILNESLKEFATTEEGIALIADAAYGWLIEGMYVISEIVAQQNYSPVMLYRINEQAESIKPIVALLESVRSNPQLAKYVTSTEHLAVLNSLSAVLRSTEKISQREVDAVRTIIAKARTGILH